MALEKWPTLLPKAPQPTQADLSSAWFRSMGVAPPGTNQQVQPLAKQGKSAGYGMVPTGYGMVPNFAGNSMWPNLPGYTATPNTNGVPGFTYGRQAPTPQPGGQPGQPGGYGQPPGQPATPNPVKPWTPPPLPGAAPPSAPGNLIAPAPARPGFDSKLALPAASRTSGLPGAVAKPVVAATPKPAAPAAGGIGGALQPILNQIIGSQYTPVTPPDVGGTQEQKNLIAYQQYLFNLANSKNDERFRQAAAALQGSGTASTRDAEELANQARGQTSQDLVSRGLTNTTIGLSANALTDRELARQKQRINEGVSQQLVNLLESRTDKAPDVATFADLMMRAAADPKLDPNAGGSPFYSSSFNGGSGNGGYAQRAGVYGAPSQGSATRPFTGQPPGSYVQSPQPTQSPQRPQQPASQPYQNPNLGGNAPMVNMGNGGGANFLPGSSTLPPMSTYDPWMPSLPTTPTTPALQIPDLPGTPTFNGQGQWNYGLPWDQVQADMIYQGSNMGSTWGGGTPYTIEEQIRYSDPIWF